MPKLHILLVFLLLALTASAQTDTLKSVELIYNGSFEDCRMCPKRVDAVGILTIVEGWYQPTKGSADYFSTCGTRECGVPQNKLGNQSPHHGEAYCGIYCSKNDYREYLQTQLKRPLRPGDSVQLTFYASLSEESTGAISTLGALFTHRRVSDTVRSILTEKEEQKLGGQVVQTIAWTYEPQICHPADSLLNDTKGWQKISGTYVAQGGEQFLTLGNFYTLERSGFANPDSLTQLLPGAYYYIDDVSLVCLNCKPEEEINEADAYLSQEKPAYQEGSTFVLKEIYFEFDRSTLLQQSYNELVKLRAMLEQYPHVSIEIRGHTDNRGSDSYNLRLSESRAQSVMNYLISKGIDARRIKAKGYGKALPIDTNDTEEGRANNRRVEFRITAVK